MNYQLHLACICGALRCVWPTGRGPATENYGSVEVGVLLMTTGKTPELGLRGAIRFIDMTTLRTFSTGVARAYRDERYSSQSGLVGQEVSELCECPRMQNAALLAPSRYPGAVRRCLRSAAVLPPENTYQEAGRRKGVWGIMSDDVSTFDPKYGCWVPAIPEPFWVRHWMFWARPSCYVCRIKFRTRDEWDTHYVTKHFLEATND